METWLLLTTYRNSSSPCSTIAYYRRPSTTYRSATIPHDWHSRTRNDPSRSPKVNHFYARQLSLGNVAIQRISSSNSVLVSVTFRYRSKIRRDRNFWFSPYHSLRVSSISWQDFIPLGDEISSNEKEKGTPPKDVILPLLAGLAWKWLPIDTDMLLIITRNGDKLISGVNIDDLEWPWTPKIRSLNNFVLCFGSTHISRVNCTEMARDRLRQPAHEIFSIECKF